MIELLNRYDSISLEEMKSVRLMNRIDTKYVTTLPVLADLIEQAKDDYFLQRIDGNCNMPYYTKYYDTEQCSMYLEHLRGRKRRQKIRIRRYESSGVSFLEVKNKNNKNRTAKKRIECNALGEGDSLDFIARHAQYPFEELSQRIENRFSRITLVNKSLTERLTIDTGLRFHNFKTGNQCALNDFVIIELKRDGNVHSPIQEMLRRLHVHPAKFSKYCMGMALTDASLRQNRFKPRLRMVEKMCDIATISSF